MYFAIVLFVLTGLVTIVVSLKTEPLEEYRVNFKTHLKKIWKALKNIILYQKYLKEIFRQKK